MLYLKTATTIDIFIFSEWWNPLPCVSTSNGCCWAFSFPSVWVIKWHLGVNFNLHLWITSKFENIFMFATHLNILFCKLFVCAFNYISIGVLWQLVLIYNRSLSIINNNLLSALYISNIFQRLSLAFWLSL